MIAHNGEKVLWILGFWGKKKSGQRIADLKQTNHTSCSKHQSYRMNAEMWQQKLRALQIIFR
jgi:hypothetical protein